MGPIVGGFVVNSISWRWDFWIVLILATIITILIEVFSTETNPRILIDRKVQRLRKELDRDDLRSCYEAIHEGPPKSTSRIMMDGLIRPMKLLFLSPLVCSMSLFISYNYGLLYLLFTTIPDVFRTTYGWSTAMSGLVYLSFGVGNIIGWVAITALSDKKVVQLTKANGNKFVPEMRLTMCPYFALLTPITFFWYGWTAYYGRHWIWPILGLMPFGTAIIGLFLPITTYLVDCYPVYGASVIAANTSLRSLVGALLPLAGPSVYSSLGLGWGNSVLGFLCVVLIPLPTLMRRYGGRLRRMEKFTLE
ncbi:MFS transporter [Candidatus Bathyarchaeota archaeon]|nr:MFS transporter [Candidatus Bathyarchaeota archaeon]